MAADLFLSGITQKFPNRHNNVDFVIGQFFLQAICTAGNEELPIISFVLYPLMVYVPESNEA